MLYQHIPVSQSENDWTSTSPDGFGRRKNNSVASEEPRPNPMNFYAWSHLKSLEYVIAPIPNVKELRQRMKNATEQFKSGLTNVVVKRELKKECVYV